MRSDVLTSIKKKGRKKRKEHWQLLRYISKWKLTYTSIWNEIYRTYNKRALQLRHLINKKINKKANVKK
jgi:hypothetical protein